MRISEKGQVTIPKNLRELAGLSANDEVRVTLEGHRIVIQSADPMREADKVARIERFLASLKKLERTGDPDLDAAAVMRATRDRD